MDEKPTSQTKTPTNSPKLLVQGRYVHLGCPCPDCKQVTWLMVSFRAAPKLSGKQWRCSNWMCRRVGTISAEKVSA